MGAGQIAGGPTGCEAGRMTTTVENQPPPAPEQTRLSPAERAELGKSARGSAPWSSHADWTPASTRPDPIDLLEEQAATRVPELVPIRHGRMAATPFTFYRGAEDIIAS